MSHIKDFKGFLNESNPQEEKWQQFYDNYMDKIADHYAKGGIMHKKEDAKDYGDRQHDDACEYADAMMKGEEPDWWTVDLDELMNKPIA